MVTYNSFIFEGHGISEKTGVYDPGAVYGTVREKWFSRQNSNNSN